MPVDVSVAPDPRQMKRLRRLLAAVPRGAATAMYRALNKTGTTLRSKLVKRVKKYLAVPQKEIRKNLTLKKATKSRLRAWIAIFGRRIPLLRFVVGNKSPGVRRRGGVSYRIRPGARRKLRRGFIARMPSGHIGVFLRRGRGGALAGRLPIGEAHGPSVVGVAQGTPGLLRTARRYASGLLQKYLSAQVKLLLERAR